MKKEKLIYIVIAILSVLIINLYTSYAYYVQESYIPILKSKVGNKKLKEFDYSLTILIKNDNDYIEVDKIPENGYILKNKKCINGSNIEVNDKKAKAEITKKDACMLYYELENKGDIILNILLENEINNEDYIISNSIPIYGYVYSHFDCINNGIITYENNKISFEGSKDKCNIYFNRNISDIFLSLYIEVDGDYIKKDSIPINKSYVLNSTSECKDIDDNIILNSIDYIDGHIVINTNKIAYCEVYLDEA